MRQAAGLASRRSSRRRIGLAKPGLIAFDSDGQIVLAEPDGSRTFRLHPSEPSPVHPNGPAQFGSTFSPDGTRVAYWQTDDWKAVGGGAESAADLWVVDVDGENAVNVTPDLLVAPWPGFPAGAWSPDGSAIAFTADKDAGMYVVPADGSAPPRVLDTGFLGLLSAPAWSPDGSSIAFVGHERLADGLFGVPKVFVIRPDGSGLEQVTDAARGEGNGLSPQWSPDGRQLLYMVYDPPWSPHDAPQADALPVELVIAERGSSGWTDRVVVPTSLNWLATFSNDGSRIAFIRSRDGMFPGDLFVVGVDGTGERVISDRLVNLSVPCWSPDDRSIAVLTGPVPAPGEDWSRLPDQVYTLFPVGDGGIVEIPAGRVDGSWACSWQRLAP